MKNIFKTITAILMIFMISVFSIMPAFAAGKLTLNSIKNLKEGDIITYTLNLADCNEDVVGLQMYVVYDKEYLEIVNNTLKFPELGSVVYNENSDDGITFNWTDVSNTADFSKKKALVTVDFRVLKGGKSDITYFISELYGIDMTYMKSYTVTYDLAVNDKVKIKGETPVLETDEEFINDNQGQFVNYVDGQGEENGDKGERETVMGVTQTPSTYQVTDVTQEVSSFDPTTIIVVSAVVLLVCAIAALVILRNVFTRGKKEEQPAVAEKENNEE